MKKPNRIARKGDTARQRAQSKPAPSAEQNKTRRQASPPQGTPLRDELVFGGPYGEDLRKDHEGFYVIDQARVIPANESRARRRCTGTWSLRLLNCATICAR